MGSSNFLLLCQIIIPFCFALFSLFIPNSKTITFERYGIFLTTILLFLLTIFWKKIIFDGELPYVQMDILPAYGMYWLFSLSAPKLYLLVIIEFNYLFIYLLSRNTDAIKRHVAFFVLLFQAILGAHILSENILQSYILQFLMAILIYFIICFSATSRMSVDHVRGLARDLAVRQIVGIALLVVGVMIVFSYFLKQDANVFMGDFNGRMHISLLDSHIGLFIYFSIATLITMPVVFWSQWMADVICGLPIYGVIPLACYISGILFFFLKISKTIFVNSLSQASILFVLFGFLSVVVICARIFRSNSFENRMANIPSLFLGLAVFALGFPSVQSLSSVFLICFLFPSLILLALFFLNTRQDGWVYRITIGFTVLVFLGLPSTPVFLVFYRLSRTILAESSAIALLFIILWFLYFGANVFTFLQAIGGDKNSSVGVLLSADGQAYKNRISFFCFFICMAMIFLMPIFID